MGSEYSILDDYLDEYPEPQPLFKEIEPSSPYPMDALGSIGSDAAKAIQRVIKAPDAICGQSIIAGIAQIAQGRADILIDGRRRPISEYFVSVGETGERKSAVDDVATLPHRNYERILEQEYIQEYSAWQREHTAWKLAKDDGLKKAKGMQAKKQHLEEMGDAPIAPAQPVLLVEEPTYEGLIKILQHGLPSVGIFTDEGGRFVGGHAMNQENALKTASGISSLWDRGEAKRTRSTHGHSTIHGKRLSMHLMLQGVVAEILMSNDIFREQGWLSRVLMTWPESTVGKRDYISENVFNDPAVIRYHDKCSEMLIEQLPMNERYELNPPILELSVQAKKLWVPFHNYCDSKSAPGKELDSIRGLANKAPEHAARLAGILSVVRGSTVIHLEEMESGIELMNYYLSEASRITNIGQINQGIRDASALLDWLQQKNTQLIYPVMIYQNAPIRKLREKKSAMEAIRILEDHGWLYRVDGQVKVDGKVRREAWRLINV